MQRDTEFGRSTLFSELREAVTHAPEGGDPSVRSLCGNGALLRALLLVHVAIAVGLSFAAATPLQWLLSFASAATVAVPATLAWLLIACISQPRLLRWRGWQQMALLMVLGTVCVLGVWVPLDHYGIAPASASGAMAPGLAGATLAGLLVASVRWRERSRLPATTVARLADLQTRIRPHFLFNTLNTAVALVRVDPRRAEEVLEDLAELFRAALVNADEITTLGAEVELARRYLDIESVRFGERLRLRWDLDPAADSARLPPLALQPLVENAVRHGVEPQDRGGSIEIRTRRRRDRVLISVTNTVPLPTERRYTRPGHGIGLASVRERLRLLHDLDADFRSGLTEDGRWRVSLSVPA